jgi:hypothetical protein
MPIIIYIKIVGIILLNCFALITGYYLGKTRKYKSRKKD